MSGKKKVEALGITLIVFIFAHSIFQTAIIVNSSLPLDVSYQHNSFYSTIGRVVIVCGLCCFLMGGAGWARLLLGLFSLFGIFASVIGLFSMSAAGVSILSPLGLCTVALAAVYLLVIYWLYMDGDVIRHFDPRGGF